MSDENRTYYRGELEREEDGRWIAAVPDVPGVLAYGYTRDEAKNKAWVLLMDIISDKLKHGELQIAPEHFDLQYS